MTKKPQPQPAEKPTDVYEQVEDAIKRHLHLGCMRNNGGGITWHYPDSIVHGNIVMRDSDCGMAKPTWEITTDEWADRVERRGLWKKVGMWNFVPADDPAAELCRGANDNVWAGRELHRLREEVDKLKEALIWCGGASVFGYGEVAHEGWVKICRPLINAR